MAGLGRPGRPRRSESVDHDSVLHLKENVVMKPVKPEVDEAEWPCFVLSDATIYRKDGKTLANPLMVHAEGPLVVHGLLEIDNDTKRYARSSGTRGAYIEVTDSTKYSFSDGPFALWVSGTSGWFEIKPSKKYLPMYRGVEEAVDLYYRLLDVHEEHNKLVKRAKKSGKKPPAPLTLDHIFLQYAVKTGNGIVRHEVEAMCDKWAEFLISHFRKEEIDWKSTPFARWLIAKHPGLEKRVDDAAKGVAISAPPPPQLEDSEGDAPRPRRKNQTIRGSQDVEMPDLAPSRSQKLPSRPLSQSQSRPVVSPVPLPEKYLNLGKPASATTQLPAQPSSPAPQPVPDDPVGRFLLILDEVAEDRPDLAIVSPSKVCNMIYFKAKIKSYHGAREICCYYAKDLVPRLDPKIWHGTLFYKWLVQTSQNWNGVLEHVSEEEIPAQVYRRARSGPRAPRIVEQPSTPGTSSNHNSVTANLRHSRHSGKRSTLRPGPSSKKRPASDMFDDEDDYDSSRGGKRNFNQSFDDDEDMDNEDDHDDEDTDDSSVAEADPNLATPSDPASLLPLPAGASRLVIQAERLPTLSPSGPDGTWTCPHEECGYVVRSADEPAAQELVEEHFRAHESNTQKIDLALMEGRRGHVPIDNLLQKIRQKGEQSLREKRGRLNDPTLEEKDRLLRDRVKTRLLV